jgi:hypothetical protein
MSLPPIGYHCGTGVGSNGIGFSSFLHSLHGKLAGFSAAQIFAASPKSFAHLFDILLRFFCYGLLNTI